jgi:hypothetical protein
MLAAVFVGLLVLTWALSRMTPGWYQPLSPNEDWVIDNADRAEKLMLDLHNVVQRVPLGEQQWSIRQDEVNSLLAIRFAPPLNADGSRSAPKVVPLVSDPVVVFTPGKVTVAARSTRIPGSDPRGGVGSVVFSVGIVQDAQDGRMGLVKLDSVWVGSLPVPRSLVNDRLQAAMPSIIKAVEEAIELQLNTRDTAKIEGYVEQAVRDVTAGNPFPLRYTIDRKQIVIKDLKVEDGRFTVVLEPPTPAAVMPRPAK